MTSLSFSILSNTNRQRAERWHPGFPKNNDWLSSDWSNALAGEVGEACNIVKKIRRIESGVSTDPTDGNLEELISDLGKECADIQLYLDLLASYFDLDLAKETVDKFNETSIRYGFPERL